jgi:hypothetical protein
MEKMSKDPPWYHNPSDTLRIYHGTTSLHRNNFESQGLQIVRRSNKRRDFGDGFYCTIRLDQARDYARQTAVAVGENGHSLIVVCEISVQKLYDLTPHIIITEYDYRWLDIIKQGRWQNVDLPYQWIYGRCGDGRTRDIQQLFEQGIDDDTLLSRLMPSPTAPFNQYDQLWFGSVEALSAVHIVDYW